MNVSLNMASQVVLVIKDPPANAGDMRREFHPQIWKIPWKRAWQSTPVFLPRESHGQRSLTGYTPGGLKESDTTEVTYCAACKYHLIPMVLSHNSETEHCPNQRNLIPEHLSFPFTTAFPVPGCNKCLEFSFSSLLLL